METTRPTISIKSHLKTSDTNEPTSAAINGILKRGNTYKFTEYKHEQIIEELIKVQKRAGMSSKQFSLALGYCETAFRQWCSGARFSRLSYNQVKEMAKKINRDARDKEQEQLKLSLQKSVSPTTMTDEQMALHLKNKGWKLQRPVTTITYEEI